MRARAWCVCVSRVHECARGRRRGDSEGVRRPESVHLGTGHTSLWVVFHRRRREESERDRKDTHVTVSLGATGLRMIKASLFFRMFLDSRESLLESEESRTRGEASGGREGAGWPPVPTPRDGHRPSHRSGVFSQVKNLFAKV